MSEEDKLFRVLAVILGIAMPESQEDLAELDLQKRKVLRSAIRKLRDYYDT